MAFRCPRCDARSLAIVSAIELPPDHRSDEVTIQIVKCSGCRFEGIAIYEESRRGALDSESWSHVGYMIDRDGLRSLKKALAACHRRRDPQCKCPAHMALRRQPPGAGWEDVIPGVHWHEPFAMRRQ